MSSIGSNAESPTSTFSSNSSRSSTSDSLKIQNEDNDNQRGTIDKKPSSTSKVPVRNQTYYSNEEDADSQSFSSNTAKIIQNNITINNSNTPIHIGPTYTSTTVHNSNCNGAISKNSTAQEDSLLTNSRKKSLSPKELEHIQNCLHSKRVIHDDEVLAISKNIGKNWKDVGCQLKFNFVKIEKWEQEAKQGLNDDCSDGFISDAVYRMLYFWVQWQDEKATIGRLAKALDKCDEVDAFQCLEP